MTLVVQHGPTYRMAKAVQARLQIAFPPARFEFGWLPSKLNEVAWRELLRRTPFIGVGLSGLETKNGGRAWNGDISFAVAVVTENAAGLDARLFGDRFAPGIYDMLDAATAILHGYSPGTNGSLSVVRAENVFSEGLGEDKAIGMLMVRGSNKITVGDIFAGSPELNTPEFDTAEWVWPFSDGYVLDVDETENQA